MLTMTRALAILNRLKPNRQKDGQPPRKRKIKLDGMRLAEYEASRTAAKQKASLKKQKVTKRKPSPREKARFLCIENEVW